VPEIIEILGVPFAALEVRQALDEVERLCNGDGAGLVAFANSYSLNLAASNPSYREVLRRANLVLNDGKGVMLAAHLQGRRFPADLNGNAMSPLVLRRAAESGRTVYFLGARPGVAQRAAERLRAGSPELKIVGVRDGYFDPAEQDGVIKGIRDTGTDILMVALGNPLQEFWLDRHLPSTGAHVGLGVGAFFDFQAGEIRRAPESLNRMGLEWVYRLAKEPRRMWRRYLLGHPLFLGRVVKERVYR
jgi:exopolysaccharide biosynthesis WecB/TagA/CpsF family protein